MASPLRFRGVLSDDFKLLTKRASSDDSAHLGFVKPNGLKEGCCIHP